MGDVMRTRDPGGANALLKRADAAIELARNQGAGTILRVDELEAGALDLAASDRKWSDEIARLMDDVRVAVHPMPHDGDSALAMLPVAGADRCGLDSAALVAMAERYGLGGELAQRQLSELCRELAARRAALKTFDFVLLPGFIGRELLADRGEQLIRLTSDLRLPASKFCVTLSESLLDTLAEQAAELIPRLRSAGFRICIDEIGSSQQPLAMIGRDWAVDFLKFELGGREGLGEIRTRRAFVAAIQTMADLSGLRTIAGCPDDRYLAEELKRLGIDYLLPLTAQPRLLGDHLAAGGG